MNSRERFLATMRFQPVDRAPDWEMGYWAGTLDRWHAEGLPRHPQGPRGLVPGAGVKGEGFPWRRDEPKDWAVHAALGLDEGIEKIAGNWGVQPAFEVQVLREDETTITRRDADGTVTQVRKDSSSLPHVLAWPVSDRATWEQLKAERLPIDIAGRLPANWPDLVREYKQRTWPLVIGGPFLGLFSALRTLIGFENMMLMFFDDPQLIHDILDHLTAMWLAVFEEVLGDTDVDYAYIWEDMSFKGGSMVSPRIFREFLLPRYRRITGFFAAHGLDIVTLDTDGNVWGLIPLFEEAGVTGLYPFEVRAGMDVAAVRAKYPRLQMLGGIDKTALERGPAAIDAELARIAPVIRSGGYVPGIDHYVHPDAPWEAFAYCRRRLAEML
ncbi:MAG: uroporphyrinogen decarboxylase family protein [Chloroflexota bacterium]